MKITWKTVAPLLIWLALYLVPVPAGLNANQWHYFAIFAAVIAGLALLFSLVAVVIGMGGHSDGAQSWVRYSTIFAFGAATWFVLSQPVPPMIGSTKATMIAAKP